MTKAEIVQALYTRVGGFSKKESADLVDLVFETMKETLGRGEKIKISGFGNFVLRDKRQRPGRNPQTGEPIKISERRVMTFKASQVLKQVLNPRAGGARPSIAAQGANGGALGGIPAGGVAGSAPPPLTAPGSGANHQVTAAAGSVAVGPGLGAITAPSGALLSAGALVPGGMVSGPISPGALSGTGGVVPTGIPAAGIPAGGHPDHGGQANVVSTAVSAIGVVPSVVSPKDANALANVAGASAAPQELSTR